MSESAFTGGATGLEITVTLCLLLLLKLLLCAELNKIIVQCCDVENNSVLRKHSKL